MYIRNRWNRTSGYVRSKVSNAYYVVQQKLKEKPTDSAENLEPRLATPTLQGPVLFNFRHKIRVCNTVLNEIR